MKALVKFIEDSIFEVVSLSESENFSFSLKSFGKNIFHTNLLSNKKQSKVFSMKWGKSKVALNIWQWLFCRRQQFTIRDYFAVSYL